MLLAVELRAVDATVTRDLCGDTRFRGGKQPLGRPNGFGAMGE
jgi:hypothetical protein